MGELCAELEAVERERSWRTCIGTLKGSLKDCDGVILRRNIVQTLGTTAITLVSSPKGLEELCKPTISQPMVAVGCSPLWREFWRSCRLLQQPSSVPCYQRTLPLS
jgi:hypothetical protein